jgi:hypothetical protein
VLAFFAIINLKSVISSAYDGQLAGVVKVDGGYSGMGIVGLESLDGQNWLARLGSEFQRQKTRPSRTLAARK